MKTLRISVDPEALDSPDSRHAIETAATILRNGGLVAFPTETVYGLGANALEAASVEKIFAAKQRPRWDPLIVHVSDQAMLARVIAIAVDDPEFPTPAKVLMDTFWPGPLTLLLPRAADISPIITAGRPLAGVRMPAHPVAQALIAAAGVPIAAPSANRFGRTSPTSAAHVLEDLDGRIDAVLDAGETPHGLESTVVDASQDPIVLYRPGIISVEELRKGVGTVIEWKAETSHTELPESLPSPGVGIRHYAPRAKLILIEGPSAEQATRLATNIQDLLACNLSVGVMLPDGFLPEDFAADLLQRTIVFDWGEWSDQAMLAHRLFSGLRTLDAAGVEIILCPLPSSDGLGAALYDRLRKASMNA
jgi:L-threonylcarbamoyladenylate synthase